MTSKQLGLHGDDGVGVEPQGMVLAAGTGPRARTGVAEDGVPELSAGDHASALPDRPHRQAAQLSTNHMTVADLGSPRPSASPAAPLHAERGPRLSEEAADIIGSILTLLIMPPSFAWTKSYPSLGPSGSCSALLQAELKPMVLSITAMELFPFTLPSIPKAAKSLARRSTPYQHRVCRLSCSLSGLPATGTRDPRHRR